MLILVGVVALLARSRLILLPGAERVGALAMLYASLLAACTMDRSVPSQARIRPAYVLLIGTGAVGLATLVSGRPPAMGFASLSVPLSILAAVAEEAFFRKTVYARLLKHGAAVAVVGSAILFALVHLPFYGVAALPVDLGAGLLFGWQRWASGTWATPAATHSVANILAVLVR